MPSSFLFPYLSFIFPFPPLGLTIWWSLHFPSVSRLIPQEDALSSFSLFPVSSFLSGFFHLQHFFSHPPLHIFLFTQLSHKSFPVTRLLKKLAGNKKSLLIDYVLLMQSTLLHFPSWPVPIFFFLIHWSLYCFFFFSPLFSYDVSLQPPPPNHHFLLLKARGFSTSFLSCTLTV